MDELQPCVCSGLRKAVCLAAKQLGCQQWLLLLGASFSYISLVLLLDRACFAHNRCKWIRWRFHRYLDLLFIAANLFAVFAALPDSQSALLPAGVLTVYICLVCVGQWMVAQAFKPQRAYSADGGEIHVPSSVDEPGSVIPTDAAIIVGKPDMDIVDGQSAPQSPDRRPLADTTVSRQLAHASLAGFATKVSVFLVLTVVAMIFLLTVHASEASLVCSVVMAVLCMISTYRVFLTASSGAEIRFTSAGSSLTSTGQAWYTSAWQAWQPSNLPKLFGQFGRARGESKFSLRELLNENIGNRRPTFDEVVGSLSGDTVFIRFSGVRLFPKEIILGELHATPMDYARCFGLDLAPQHNHWVCFDRCRTAHFLCYLRCLAKCHMHQCSHEPHPLPLKACLYVVDPILYTWPQDPDLHRWVASARPPLELPSVEYLNEIEASLPFHFGNIVTGARSSSEPPPLTQR